MGMTLTATASWTLPAGVMAWLMLATISVAFAGEAALPPEPAGYWTGPMNGKVPATITGGKVIGTQELADMIRQDDPVLVDVVPAPRQPSGQTTPWLPVPHRDIPRSVWIPGVGSGVISQAMSDHFRARLAELTGHDREKLIVIYCRSDCWASWNAAKRTIEEGYRRVSWYPDGVEAWQGAGFPTEIAAPEGPAVQ